MTLYRRFEGGAVYTYQQGGRFLVVIDESTMTCMLEPEDLEGIELVKVLAFDTEQARTGYLQARFAVKQTGRDGY